MIEQSQRYGEVDHFDEICIRLLDSYEENNIGKYGY